MKKIAALLFMVVLGCVHQAPRPISNWAKCETSCAEDGTTVRGLAEDETHVYCLCERRPVGT